MAPLTTVLIANRGEIARRIMATCRRRGLATVAVFSDADASALHPAEADRAVRLPGVTPAETYLRGELIIDAARRAGADAIHPGYGFLSENADFAAAVQAAGLTWIGPPPAAIELMGSKVAAKQVMADAGVPVLAQLDPEAITAAELPVLVKASAGGGGRGMRIVRDLAELPDALASAAREAAGAFGDATVFCERFVERGHHVEVQVMADGAGTVWALGERECSLQRRHQKVIEETPSPLVDRVGGDLRERLLAAGRAAAAAVGYRGAGTVEFLADADGSFYFLEMNTRLQVEHPVTECVTGLDLVGMQLDIAAGQPLLGEEPTSRGHAIEARLYAEDPARGWEPRSGILRALTVPDVTAQFEIPIGHGIRLDAGVTSGSEIGVHYDPMLAKLIAVAPTREAAARELAAALRRARIHGVTTNRDLLVASLLHPEFLAGEADTGFYERHTPAELGGSGLDPALAAVVAALSDAAADRAAAPVLAAVPSGFRTVPSGYQRRAYTAPGADYRITRESAAFPENRSPGAGTIVGQSQLNPAAAVSGEIPQSARAVVVGYRHTRGGVELETLPLGVEAIAVVQATGERVVLEVDGIRMTYAVSRYPADPPLVVVDGSQGSVTLQPVPRFTDPSTQLAVGALVAPMPGTVTRLAVEVGDAVAAGAPLLWLEAMKMEHAVTAPYAGVVSSLAATVGQQVDQGSTLAVIDATSEPDSAATASGSTFASGGPVQ